MKDTTCNGWRNAHTWTVNLWFGDSFAEYSENMGEVITPDACRETVEAYVEEFIGHDSIGSGFIWDMLDLNSVDWDALASHHQPEVDWIA